MCVCLNERVGGCETERVSKRKTDGVRVRWRERVQHQLNSQAPLEINVVGCSLNNLYTPKIKSKALFSLLTDRWALWDPRGLADKVARARGCAGTLQHAGLTFYPAAITTTWLMIIFHHGINFGSFGLTGMDLELNNTEDIMHQHNFTLCLCYLKSPVPLALAESAQWY